MACVKKSTFFYFDIEKKTLLDIISCYNTQNSSVSCSCTGFLIQIFDLHHFK